jgi:hypothetical protein
MQPRPGATREGVSWLYDPYKSVTTTQLAAAWRVAPRAGAGDAQPCDAAMALDTYAGLFTEDLEAVADRLSEGALAARTDAESGTGKKF